MRLLVHQDCLRCQLRPSFILLNLAKPFLVLLRLFSLRLFLDQVGLAYVVSFNFVCKLFVLKVYLLLLCDVVKVEVDQAEAFGALLFPVPAVFFLEKPRIFQNFAIVDGLGDLL